MVTLACLVLSSSCSSERRAGVAAPSVEEGDQPPVLPNLPRMATVRFQNDGPDARDARLLVQGQLNRVGTDVILANEEVMAGFATAHWGPERGHCRSDWRGSGTCTASYDVCRTTRGFQWSVIVDGDCGGDLGGLFDNWLKGSGFTDVVADTGRFIFYDNGAESIRTAWEWWVAPDRLTTTWVFYKDGTSEVSRVGTLVRTANPDGSVDDAWAPKTGIRWETHMVPGFESGSMRLYAQDAPDRLSDAITWEAGHGSWVAYGEQEQEVARRTW